MNDFKLNPRLQSVLPPLSYRDESEGILKKDPQSKRRSLEEQILEDGEIREPLIVWDERGELVDGYERHAVAAKHKLKTRVVRKSFPNLLAAQSYRIRSQITRRNVRPLYLAQHLLANEELVKAVKAEAQKRQKTGVKAKGEKGDWMQVLADMAGIGRSTVYQQQYLLNHPNEGFRRIHNRDTAYRAYLLAKREEKRQERNLDIIEAGKTVPKFADGDPVLNQILAMDVMQGLRKIPDQSVHLVFTSPPYPLLSEKLRYPEPAYNYDGDYPGYLDWLETVFAESKRILVPGGRLIVNTDNVSVPRPNKQQLKSGWFDRDWQRVMRRNLYGDLMTRIVGNIGFTHMDDIVWWKGAYVGTKPVLGSNSPAFPRLQRNWEDVTVYLNGDRDSRLAGKPGKIEIAPDEYTFWTGGDYSTLIERDGVGWKEDASVWRISPDSSSRRQHPAAFPIELPWRLTLLYTFQGQTVVDPFAGIGSTLAAANALGRNYIGIEAVAGYVPLAHKRISGAFRDRVRLRAKYFPKRVQPKRARNFDAQQAA